MTLFLSFFGFTALVSIISYLKTRNIKEISSDGYFQYVRGVHSCFRGGDSPPRLSRAWHRLTPRGGRREAKDRPGPLEYDQLKARWAPLS